MKQITQLHNIIELQKESNALIFNQGKEKARLEGKIEIAKVMIIKSYPVDDIVVLTGLSIKQVEQLKQTD